MWSVYVPLFGTPWTVALQTPLSMAISRQEYWSRKFLGIFLSRGSSQPRSWSHISYVSHFAGTGAVTGPPVNDEVQHHKCCLRCQPSVTQQCLESNLYLFHPAQPRQQCHIHMLEKPKKPYTANPTWKITLNCPEDVNFATSNPTKPLLKMIWIMAAWPTSPFTKHCTPCTVDHLQFRRNSHSPLSTCMPSYTHFPVLVLQRRSDISFSKIYLIPSKGCICVISTMILFKMGFHSGSAAKNPPAT